jgi:PRTRC genetic system protein C
MVTVYKYVDYEYKDEAGELSTEEVKQQLTQYFPELAAATAEEKTDADGNKVVTFVKRAGTKGLMQTLSDADLLKLRRMTVIAENDKADAVAVPPEILLKLLDEVVYVRQLLGQEAKC